MLFFNLARVHVQVSRKGAKKRKSKGARVDVVFFAPYVFPFLAPLRETHLARQNVQPKIHPHNSSKPASPLQQPRIIATLCRARFAHFAPATERLLRESPAAWLRQTTATGVSTLPPITTTSGLIRLRRFAMPIPSDRPCAPVLQPLAGRLSCRLHRPPCTKAVAAKDRMRMPRPSFPG